ncbi:uncharacterized protein LOC108949854 [Ciona intestinalis]
MLIGKAEDAIGIKDQLNKLFKEKFHTTPNEIKKIADTIRGEGKDMETILFYQIAAEFYRNEALAGLVGIANCALGIKESIKAMLSRDEGLKPILRNKVIPLMRDMREMIRQSDGVSEEDRCVQEVLCLHWTEYSEYLIGDINGREKTLKEAIAIMERAFKERAGQYNVYGTCLNNLGVTYLGTSRPNDACQYYLKAIAAYEKAEDINDDQRAEKIDGSKRNLERVKKPLQPSVSKAMLSLQDMQINQQEVPIEEMNQEVDDVELNKHLSESSPKHEIGSSGGKLEVGGCKLVVPPGALEEDVEIKLTASLPLKTKFLETPTLQCEPECLTFKKQVTIKLQTHVVLDKETVRRCKLLLSKDGIKWEETKTRLEFSDNFISFQTNHFSWWKVIFEIIEKSVAFLYKIQLNFLLYQKAGAVVWKVCWNLDLATRDNILKEEKFSQETWIIPGGKNLILCIAPREKNTNVEINPSMITKTADQINRSCHFDRRFEVQGQFSNRIWLKAYRDCGNLHEEEEILFPLPSTQDRQPTSQIVNVVGNKLDHAAVLCKDVNIQSSSSED